jgi:hypothetical protein
MMNGKRSDFFCRIELVSVLSQAKLKTNMDIASARAKAEAIQSTLKSRVDTLTQRSLKNIYLTQVRGITAKSSPRVKPFAKQM